MPGPLDTVLCKTAGKYNYHGVELVELKEIQRNLFASGDKSQQLVATRGDKSQQPEREKEAPLFASINLTETTTVVVMPKQAALPVTPQVAPIPLGSLCNPEFIATCLSHGCSVDMLLETFIASVVTLYQQDCDPKVAQGLLAPIIISTICIMYAQYKLIIDGFIKARLGSSSTDSTQALLIKNQLQALAGTLSAIIDGTRFFFSITVVFSHANPSVKYMAAGIAGSGKFGSFLMAKGHAACDVPFGSTLMGKVVYGMLTAPITPDFIKYVTAVMPLVGGAIYSSAIVTIKDIAEVENTAATYLCYSVAFFSGIMGFLIQKCYICDVMRKNIGKNAETVESWNEFWYGGYNHCIMYNGDETALRDNVNSLTSGIYKLGNEYFQITSDKQVVKLTIKVGQAINTEFNTNGTKILTDEECSTLFEGYTRDSTNCLQMASHALKRFVDIFGALPITAIDTAEKMLSVCCYFVLAMLPIQIMALVQYVSQPALAYCVFYQIFHNTQGIIQMYTGEDTSPLTPEAQYLATLVSVPLGLASAFTILNLTGGEILKGTNKVYNSSSTAVVDATPAPNSDTTALLPSVDTPPAGSTLWGRLSSVATFAKSSASTAVNSMIAQFKGENKLGKQ